MLRPFLALALCFLPLALWSMGRQVSDASAPVKPTPKVEAPKGHMEQFGKRLILSGNSTWEAQGEIRADGRVYLLWLNIHSGETAPSVYDLKGKSLVGLWGYSWQCEILPNGNIVGTVCPDVVSPVEPPPAGKPDL